MKSSIKRRGAAALRSVGVSALVVICGGFPAVAQLREAVVNCGTLIVSAANPSLCLSVVNFLDRSPARVQLCGDPLYHQTWLLRVLDDGGLFLEAAGAPGRILEVADFQNDNAAIIQVWGRNSGNLQRVQQWLLLPGLAVDTGHNFIIANRLTGRCMDMWGGVTEGAAVMQYNCYAGANQLWTFKTVVSYGEAGCGAEPAGARRLLPGW